MTLSHKVSVDLDRFHTRYDNLEVSRLVVMKELKSENAKERGFSTSFSI